MRSALVIGLPLSAVLFTATARPQSSLRNESGQVLESPSCSVSDGQRASPEVSVEEVKFSGVVQLDIPAQSEIAAAIERRAHGTSLSGATDMAGEIARAEWQDRGYFNVRVEADGKVLSSSVNDQRIAIAISVVEGLKYKLAGILFVHNRAIPNVQALRSLFPIRDGETFSRKAVVEGLANLRKAYGAFGYANFTAVPNTTLNDVNSHISLEVDLDEGKQFHVAGVTILGLDAAAQADLLKNAPIRVGAIYNERLTKMFAERRASLFPDCPCRLEEQLRLDERNGLAFLTFDARPCA